MTWQEDVLARVDRTTKRTLNNGPSGPWVGVLLRVHPDIRKAMHQSAKQRGISMQTWLRRVIVMAISKELGTGYAVWTDRLPTPVDYGGVHFNRQIHTMKGPRPERPEELAGMCTHPGCDEIHL